MLVELLAANFHGLAKNWYLKFVQPTTVAKFIIKSSLFVQKFKNAIKPKLKTGFAFS
jgi:hypothetical protein